MCAPNAKAQANLWFVFVATFRVARLTLQAPKLWSVGVATDRDARHACLRFFSFVFPVLFFFCLRFFSFYCFLFFFLLKIKKYNKKKGLQGVHSEMAQIYFFLQKVSQRNRAAIEAKRN